jgi:hypothetical protein
MALLLICGAPLVIRPKRIQRQKMRPRATVKREFFEKLAAKHQRHERRGVTSVN